MEKQGVMLASLFIPVFHSNGRGYSEDGRAYIVLIVPLKRIVPRMTICSKPCVMIFFHISTVMRCSRREYGFRLSKSSEGGYVAKASDARVSMIRFTQSI